MALLWSAIWAKIIFGEQIGLKQMVGIAPTKSPQLPHCTKSITHPRPRYFFATSASLPFYSTYTPKSIKEADNLLPSSFHPFQNKNKAPTAIPCNQSLSLHSNYYLTIHANRSLLLPPHAPYSCLSQRPLPSHEPSPCAPLCTLRFLQPVLQYILPISYPHAGFFTVYEGEGGNMTENNIQLLPFSKPPPSKPPATG